MENNQNAIKPSSEKDKEERQWAAIVHLAGFVGVLVPILGSILGPLIIWIIKKEDFPLVNDQGKEAVNFQISMLIYTLIALALMLIVIGFILLFVLVIVEIVSMIKAAIKASHGEKYRYPLTIRFIK